MIEPKWLRPAGRAGVGLGLLALVIAGLWWWVVFRQLLLAEYISVPRALPCIATQSPLCRLAQALCGADHVLGIKRYSVVLFWVGAGLMSLGIVATAAPRLGTRLGTREPA